MNKTTDSWARVLTQSAELAAISHEVACSRLISLGVAGPGPGAQHALEDMAMEKMVAFGEAWLGAFAIGMRMGTPADMALGFLQPYRRRVKANRRQIANKSSKA